MNNKGFSFSGLVYPLFLILITLITVIVSGMIITSFSLEKIKNDISGVISGDNTQRSLKKNFERAMTNLTYNEDYVATDGVVKPSLTDNINTTDWTGRFYRTPEGDVGFIDNKSFCAYKMPGMTGIEVYNSGDCIERMKSYGGIESLVCPPVVKESLDVGNSNSIPTTNGVENQIMIVTNIAVNGFMVSETIPTAQEGMIWFVTGKYNDLIIKQNNANIKIAGVKQYQSNAWVDVPTYQYINNSWELITNTPTFYTYNGSYQVFEAPSNGKYLLEAWGSRSVSTTEKGRGAYTRGIIYLTSGTKLYIYAGQEGNSGNGTSFNCGVGDNGGNPGGGATDFRYFQSVPNTTQLIWNNIEGLTSRIMVAGGAGAGSGNNNYNKGSGGTLTGITGGNIVDGAKVNGATYGGGQTYSGLRALTNYAQGTFGYAKGGCTGGGGYYPGGGATCANGAGGGSSFISGYTGAVAVTSLTSSAPKAGCTELTTDNNCSIHFTGMKFTNPAMIAGNQEMPNFEGTGIMIGNDSSGRAKITLIG